MAVGWIRRSRSSQLRMAVAAAGSCQGADRSAYGIAAPQARAVWIKPACRSQRDAARPLLWNLARARRQVGLAWADADYQARRLAAWATICTSPCRSSAAPMTHTFQVLPRRWVVERTLAWISKFRRTVRDYERLPGHHEAMIQWAMITIIARRLARPAQPKTG